MKKLLLTTAAVAFAATGAPAFASNASGPDDSEDFDVTATVPMECSLDDPADVDFGTLSVNPDSGSNALQLTGGTQTDIQQIWVSCNYAANIEVSATDMLSDTPVTGPDAGDFTDTLPYDVALEPSDGTAFAPVNHSSGAGSTTVAQAGPFHDLANVTVTFDPSAVTKLPVAGTYTGTVSIELGAT